MIWNFETDLELEPVPLPGFGFFCRLDPASARLLLDSALSLPSFPGAVPVTVEGSPLGGLGSRAKSASWFTAHSLLDVNSLLETSIVPTYVRVTGPFHAPLHEVVMVHVPHPCLVYGIKAEWYGFSGRSF